MDPYNLLNKPPKDAGYKFDPPKLLEMEPVPSLGELYGLKHRISQAVETVRMNEGRYRTIGDSYYYEDHLKGDLIKVYDAKPSWDFTRMMAAENKYSAAWKKRCDAAERMSKSLGWQVSPDSTLIT